MRATILSILMLLTFVADTRDTQAATPSPVALRGEKVAVEVECREGRLHERYLAICDGSWKEVATSDGHSSGSLSVVIDDGKPLLATVQNISLAEGTLVEELLLGQHRVLRKLTIVDNGEWIHVVTHFEAMGKASVCQVFDQFKFSHRPDWSFSPSVGGFNPDAQYKAPLILTQSGGTALGIVPDLTMLHQKELQRCNHVLNLDIPGGPVLAVGFMPAQLASHSIYTLNSTKKWSVERAVENAYYLLVTASAAQGQAYRQAVRFHWAQFGRLEQRHAADQQAGTDVRYKKLALWDDWRKMVWHEESPQMWLSVQLPDGSTGGGVRTKRWGPGPSVYFSAWFNTLRTSYGMALYARRTQDIELQNLAKKTIDLALKAPGQKGAFKCIAVPTTNGTPTIWAAGDGSGGSTKDGFLGYDMCWTGYWLLKCRAAAIHDSEGILLRCRQLARFLIAQQMNDGMLPTRFAEDGSVQEELSRTVKAETGVVVLFLLELYVQDSDPSYLKAAKRGMDFLERQVIPQRQWYDFETFWSCSPRTACFDKRTEQWPANNLALTQTVAAYLLASRITGDNHYLAAGERLLDYLLLYQQCWTNPVLENLTSTAMLLGGFTTQNSDAEWSDARQSQIGNILLDYYRSTGKVEYLERGIAALRAQFPISPSENWAHNGYGGKAGVSSFHWGSGSGMAGIEIEEEFLRDVVVDVPTGRGVGVNGLNVVHSSVRNAKIELEIHTPFTWVRPPVAVFHQANPACRYSVHLNGSDIGTWSGADLEKGIPLPLCKNR